MDRAKLNHVAKAYGTPSFLFDESVFYDRACKIRGIFGDSIALCYAIKANPFLIPMAAKCMDRLEVCSPGELAICKSMHVDAGMVVFSGVNKTAESISDAIDYGVGVITAESLKHVRLIEGEAAARNKTIEVLLRLNAGSQFGMSREDLFNVVQYRSRYPHIKIVGIHYFVGTQRKKLKHQRKELEMLVALMDELEQEYAFETMQLEYGPGLGVPLFEDDSFEDTLSPARELCNDLKSVANRVGLTVEMGRFFATDCGVYLTAVNDIKSNKGTHYCIVDGGINHLTYHGQLMGMKNPIVENINSANSDDELRCNWCICGSLCTTGDVLARNIEMGEMHEHDVLAFRNCGAYSVTEGIYLLLSRSLPSIVIMNESGDYRLARPVMETSLINTESKF